MPTDHPPYKNVRNAGGSHELDQADLTWDVSEEPDPLDASGPPEPQPPTAFVTEAPPTSELLRRFPRPGAAPGRETDEPRRRRSPLFWIVGVVLAVASAAGAAWLVTGT